MTWGLPIVSLFSGYGGLDLGLERAGLGRTVVQCEVDPYCREVERRHWPDVLRINDVREVSGGTVSVRGGILCGGFPCQPVSVAGKRLAKSDPRWLWPEFARVARELAPAIVVVENVPGLRTAGLRDVLADLAALGFDAEWHCFRAWDLGAPHERNRLWLVATHPMRVKVRVQPGWLGRVITDRIQQTRQASPVAGYDREAVESADALRRLESARCFAIKRGWAECCGWTLDPAPRVDDGPADGLDRGGRERARKAAGNGVVVACAQAVGEAIRESVEVIA